MGTISKALGLLDTLSLMTEDAGLTEIAQACSLDKATARRFLVELERHGFVEQLPQSRKYRIGSAPVRLGRIREARYPFLRTAAPFARELADQVDETVHLSEFSGGRLSTVHVEDSTKAHRVFVSVGTVLPFHATASGIAFISSCPHAEFEAALHGPLPRFTSHTPREPDSFRRLVDEARANGFSINRQGFEAGVISASAAIKAPGARPIGCVTIAAPLVRTDDERIRTHGLAAIETAKRISDAFFGADLRKRAEPLSRRSA
ncbi:IclR family transcriptional regulator [Rhizobium sp. Root708]|uniref:IclR family transcriptional regulator n=1 Tax=Rhizobium sp. Root708 TaxID=1736592 RepID=UPI0006F472AE|nr:IclR family transcriptional regulator [Rhizobium sp. Root708]KRB55149.1 IclR family transcriptional regulator [Rhizobium sp. Root708]